MEGSSSACPKKKGAHSWKRYTEAHVPTMWPPRLWPVRLSGTASTGLQRKSMLSNWSRRARRVSSMRRRATNRRKPCKSFHPPGRSRSGGWTSSASCRAVGGYEYLLVAIDMFSKWVEVEPVRKVTAQAAVKFF